MNTRLQSYGLLGVCLMACPAMWGAGEARAADAAVGRHLPVRASDTYAGESINVRDFGAKGDGQTDDTEAIRSAVKAAFERRQIPQHPRYNYFVSFVEVYFPSGHYLVRDTIDISYMKLRGENYAAVEQLDPDKDLFYAHDAWRQLIEGLTFLGGKGQLNLGNPNVDTGHVTVRDCHFYHSGAAAVQMRKGSNSTFFKVENCVFKYCEQCVINYCDKAVVRDCWMTTVPLMRNKAVMENYGVLHVETLLGVPQVRRGEPGFEDGWVDPNGRRRMASNQRWIDNYGTVTARDCRFGGEDGGFAAVWNFAHYSYEYPVVPNSVTLEDCSAYNAQSTLVVLKEVPNVLKVVNCQGLNDCWIVRVAPGLDLDTYFDPKGQPFPVVIDIRGNYEAQGSGLPEQMLPYQLGEIVSTAQPRKGNWQRGQFVRNLNAGQRWDETRQMTVPVVTAALDEPYGWFCTESGKPGKWAPVKFTVPPQN